MRQASPAITRSPLVVFSFGLLLVISAYFPGLDGPLVFDDQLNISENPGVAIHDLSSASLKQALLSNESGALKRVLPALSFGINHYFAGGFDNTFPFKVTNVIVHCLNSALLFWLACLLWPRLALLEASGSRSNEAVFAALFIAFVWALHPLQLTSVLYVVQRMTSMAATAMLLGLCLFALGRVKLAEGRPGGLRLMYAGVVGGTVLGLGCKENAILLPLYAAVIEFTLFDRRRLPNTERKAVLRFFVATLFIPFALGLIYAFVYPGRLLAGFANRPFTPGERLLTESRVLWFYLYMLAVPDVTVMGLFHDDFPLSKGWLTPLTTLISIATWFAVVALVLQLRRSVPVLAFSVLWFLAGQSLESSLVPLQIIHEHRNYLPSVGPIAGICFLVVRGFASARSKVFRVPVALFIVLGLYWASLNRALHWQDESGLIENLAFNHPYSPSSQYLMGEILQKRYNAPADAYAYYFRAAQLEPTEAGFLISLNMATPVDVRDEFELHKVSPLVDPARITEMLRSGPVSAWAMRALDVASKCVAAGHPACRGHVHDVRGWLAAFTANPLKRGKHRRYFFMRKFDIEMNYKLYREAEHTILQAKRMDGDFPLYDLMYADVLASEGNYAEAEQKLNFFETRLAANATNPYQTEVAKMRQALSVLKARRGASGQRIAQQRR